MFPSGYFRISSGIRCLDVSGGKTTAGARVVIYTCHNELHQQWETDVYGRLLNRQGRMALTVSANNRDLILAPPNQSVAQRWKVQGNRILSQLNNLGLTYDLNSTTALLPVYLSNQGNTWEIIPVKFGHESRKHIKKHTAPAPAPAPVIKPLVPPKPVLKPITPTKAHKKISKSTKKAKKTRAQLCFAAFDPDAPLFSIKHHKERSKYVLKSECHKHVRTPPKCKNIGDYDIRTHPDINKYVPKTKLNQAVRLIKQLKKRLAQHESECSKYF